MPLTLHGVTILSPDLCPGGWPSATLEVVSVAAEAVAGVTTGRAVTSSSLVAPFFSMRGEYVDVARSLTATTDIGTEVLNKYVGVVRVGVGTT
jgi:hypothetical protein